MYEGELAINPAYPAEVQSAIQGMNEKNAGPPGEYEADYLTPQPQLPAVWNRPLNYKLNLSDPNWFGEYGKRLTAEKEQYDFLHPKTGAADDPNQPAPWWQSTFNPDGFLDKFPQGMIHPIHDLEPLQGPFGNDYAKNYIYNTQIRNSGNDYYYNAQGKFGVGPDERLYWQNDVKNAPYQESGFNAGLGKMVVGGFTDWAAGMPVSGPLFAIDDWAMGNGDPDGKTWSKLAISGLMSFLGSDFGGAGNAASGVAGGATDAAIGAGSSTWGNVAGESFDNQLGASAMDIPEGFDFSTTYNPTPDYFSGGGGDFSGGGMNPSGGFSMMPGTSAMSDLSFYGGNGMYTPAASNFIDAGGMAANGLGVGGSTPGMTMGGMFDSAAPWVKRANSLMSLYSGAKGIQLASSLRDRARLAQIGSSPFDASGSRAQANTMIQRLMSNPGGVAADDPAYQMRMQAAQRATAPTGQRSGAMAVAAANSSTDWYNQMLQTYGGLAGAGFSPSAGLTAGLGAETGAAGLYGQALASLGYGVAQGTGGNADIAAMIKRLQALGGT